VALLRHRIDQAERLRPAGARRAAELIPTVLGQLEPLPA